MENIKKIASKSLGLDFFSDDSLVTLFSLSHSNKKYYFKHSNKFIFPLRELAEKNINNLFSDINNLFDLDVKEFRRLFSLSKFICIDEINEVVSYNIQFKIKIDSNLYFKNPIYSMSKPFNNNFEVIFYEDGRYTISNLNDNKYYDSLTEFYLYSNFSNKIISQFGEIDKDNKKDMIDVVLMYFFWYNKKVKLMRGIYVCREWKNGPQNGAKGHCC